MVDTADEYIEHKNFIQIFTFKEDILKIGCFLSVLEHGTCGVELHLFMELVSAEHLLVLEETSSIWVFKCTFFLVYAKKKK